MAAKISVLLTAAAVLFLLSVQVLYLNRFAATWDQVDFALALNRFDLLAMQPHFPGYPYFIFGGTLVHLFLNSEPASLTLFNVLFYASTLFPLYKLFCSFLTRSQSTLAAGLLYSSSYTLVIVNQPMSEGAAIACLWWFLWSIQKAMNSSGQKWLLLPLFLFSLLLGIRLSYLFFGAALLFLFYVKWLDGLLSKKQLGFSVLLAAVFQLIWIAALVASEGSVTEFLKLALAFTDGHFNDWGNTAAADSLFIWQRVSALFIENWLWTGVFVQSTIVAALYGSLIVLLAIYFKSHFSFASGRFTRLIWLLICLYSLWALFAQNVDKPRHALPLIVLSLFLFWICFFSINKRAILYISMALLIVQSAVAAQLVKKQANAEPASYQLAGYLTSIQSTAPVVYTWEEGRVLEYLNVPVSFKEIQTYELFLQDQSYYKNRPIYITGKVMEGFQAQGFDVTSRLTKKKVFVSSALFDPVYSRIILYEWK